MTHTIVLADDEPYILHVLDLKLTHKGFAVHVASDGEEALSQCLCHHPDLIITDYSMPGLNGLEVVRRYREQVFHPLPAMLITAREHDLDPQELQDARINLVVAKPFSPRQVVCQAMELIQSRPAVNDVA